MGLDIGIISIRYLERPQDMAYEFAWELAIEASVNGYMYGEGNNWGAFTQRQVLRMLDAFVASRGLDASAKGEILAWVQSLPWDGWRDDLDPGAASVAEGYDPILDYEQDQDGGLIEVHFNW